jgi:molybdopterin-guanine dinucleotide biosynthesis protein A
MGLPKATLPFGPELMLQRVVRLLRRAVDPIVVVAAPRQVLPPLPDDIVVARDEREARGPLEGLLAGLSALAGQADAAYATSCDVPLLVPAFVREMIARLDDAEIAVPQDQGFVHPLAAVYRTSVVPHIRALLEADQLRPAFLFERVNTVRVPVAELQAVDARLTTLRNLNHPAEYLASVEEAGFAVDPVVAEHLRGR